MEVKVVITPSAEMTELVEKVIAVLGNKPQNPAFIRGNCVAEEYAAEKDVALPNPAPAIEHQEQVNTVKEDEQVVEKPTRKRRTKEEIEAEKAISGPDTVPQAPAQAPETRQEVYNGKLPDLVTLRTMTVARSNSFDVPAKLREFGHESVTTLSKDPNATKAYYEFLLTIKAAE